MIDIFIGLLILYFIVKVIIFYYDYIYNEDIKNKKQNENNIGEKIKRYRIWDNKNKNLEYFWANYIEINNYGSTCFFDECGNLLGECSKKSDVFLDENYKFA